MIGVTSQEEAFEECYMVSDQKSYFELWPQRQTSAPCELNFLSFDDLLPPWNWHCLRQYGTAFPLWLLGWVVRWNGHQSVPALCSMWHGKLSLPMSAVCHIPIQETEFKLYAVTFIIFLIDLFLIFINIFYLNYFTKISSLSYCYNYIFCHNMIIYYMYITTIIGKTRKKKLSSFSGRINGIKKF